MEREVLANFGFALAFQCLSVGLLGDGWAVRPHRYVCHHAWTPLRRELPLIRNLTASLRIQTTEANKSDFPSVSPERAFADFVVCSLILHFFCVNFIN